MNSTLKLFNGIYIKDSNNKISKEMYENVFKESLKYGIIIDIEVVAYLGEKESINLLNNYTSMISWNNAFYKSWEKIIETPDKIKIIDQILHYITTYGFEAAGIESDYVYIPKGIIDLPDFEVNLLRIKGFTKDQLISKIETLTSGIALKEETQLDIINVMKEIDFPVKNYENIKNKELKIRLYNVFNTFPKNNIEFLRYLIYVATGTTLIIKNKDLIEKIKQSSDEKIKELLNSYKDLYGLKSLAEIFFRYKPIWLAFKKYDSSLMNRMRKLANKYHKPIKEDYLNQITAILKSFKEINFCKLEKELKAANQFRKIRLLYALLNMESKKEEVVYSIRNGKSYSTTRLIKFDRKEFNKTKEYVYNSIVSSLKDNIKDKTFYFNDSLYYALPATEKQFIGNLPNGSYIKVEEKNVIFGVHWNNVDYYRVDLDLSLTDMSGTKIGWDSKYSDNETYFSGDLTDAPLPNGATELFGINTEDENIFLINLNYFNFSEDIDVPYSIVVVKDSINNLRANHNHYTLNPNKMIIQVNSIIDVKQLSLGIVKTSKGKAKIYFSQINDTSLRSSIPDEKTKIKQKFLVNNLENTIDLKQIIKDAGGIIKENKKNVDYNFDVEELSKDKIVELFN